MARPEFLNKKVIIARRNGKYYLRLYPEYEPTPNQLRARIAFAMAAKKAKGRKKTGNLPPAAEIVAEEMRNLRFGETPRLKKWAVAAALALLNLPREVEDELMLALTTTPQVLRHQLRTQLRRWLRSKLFAVYATAPTEKPKPTKRKKAETPQIPVFGK